MTTGNENAKFVVAHIFIAKQQTKPEIMM